MSEDSRKVLIIDDDKNYTDILVENMQERGYIVEVSRDGMDIISKVRIFGPDIVLLDLVIPKKNGFEILVEIREIVGEIELPIIILTGNHDPECIIEGLEMGANDYLMKPIKMKIAMARIKSLIRLKDLSHKMMKYNTLQAINAMVVTYNHDIINPLSIAMGNLKNDIKDMDQKRLDDIKNALDRVNSIVRKIHEVTFDELEFKSYLDKQKMVKLL